MVKRFISKNVIKDIAIVAVGVIVIWIGLQLVFGTENPFYVVASESMVPELQVYDVLIVQGHVLFEEIQIGDIIVFDKPSGHDKVIVHRVVSITGDEPKTIRTKGDNNVASVPGTDFPITEKEYIGKVEYVIPQIGYVTQILKPPVNYILIVLVIGVMIVKEIIKRRNGHEFDDSYDKKSDLFLHPYKELQDYFSSYPIKGTLLDLGCGQGRDSLFLASIGYQVTAVDSSKVGVKQMISKAQSQEFKIDGIVADFLDLKMEKKFDVILFDMVLHGYEKPIQHEILSKYSKSLNKKGILCIVFPDDLNTDHFMGMLESMSFDWKLLDEIIVKDVPKLEGEDDSFTFVMMVVQVDC